MSATKPSDDVVSISSASDNDSDCQIVKVVPLPAKRGKNRSTRWETKPSTVKTKRETAMADRRGREMKIRQRENADNKDRLGAESASAAYEKWLHEASMERRRDGVCEGGLQGTKQRILKDGHLSLMGEDAQTSHQHSVDPKLSSTSCPSLFQGLACKQEVRHQGDETWGITRSRSSSTATLDFSPRMSAARVEDLTEPWRDGQEIFSMLDEPSETIDMAHSTGCSALNPGGAVSSSSACPTPSRVTWLKEESDVDAARLTQKRRSRHKSHANDDPFRSRKASQHGIGSRPETRIDRHGLTGAGRRRVWDSIVNVTAFNALPGPLFTRPKEVLREVTYADAMKERAKRKRMRGFNV